MGTLWNQWTADEAEAVLAELASSGKSMAQFARSHGVSIRRLTYWRTRLGKADAPVFVEVAVPADTTPHIDIVRDGIVVRVREDLDVDRLARIVDALAGQPRRC
jgi:transposase-like protein